MLSPHPSTGLEYWFFKVNAGSVALLVDWIAYRRRNENVLRVSIHSDHLRTVLFGKLPSPMIEEQNFLTTQRTVGQLDDVSWALDIECADERVEPDVFPGNLLRMPDLILVSAPMARFTGWIRHGPLQFDLEHELGMISHYWGRQLAHEWWWISANQFDREGIAVECAVFRSSLWGSPIRLLFAYLYLRSADERKLIMSPPATVRVKGTPEKFEIQFQPIVAKAITLRAQGQEYGDLGDGISNTWVGDLEIWQGDKRIGRAKAQPL
jgi:hypothetical protein